MKFLGWVRLSGLALLLFGSTVAFGEAMPLQPGKVETYTSPNGRYAVETKILGSEHGATLAQLAFKADGQELWNHLMPEPPSEVAIADAGNVIALTNWGWRDECASANLEFYDEKGSLMSRVEFGEAGANQSGLKWIALLQLAPDGSRCVIAEDGREKALFSSYDSQTGALLWERRCGYAEACEVKMDGSAQHTAVATRNYNTGDMDFLLLNIRGEVIWQRQITHNFSWEVRDYIVFSPDGQGFKIFDQTLQKYIEVAFQLNLK